MAADYTRWLDLKEKISTETKAVTVLVKLKMEEETRVQSEFQGHSPT
jgi:hypothetical protein